MHLVVAFFQVLLIDAQSVHPERLVLIADSVLRQGFVEVGRNLDKLIIA
jgi:hypothetical protein